MKPNSTKRLTARLWEEELKYLNFYPIKTIKQCRSEARCEEKVAQLRFKILKPLRDLNSPSLRKRMWASIKTVLKQTVFESLQKDIERATSILKVLSFPWMTFANPVQKQIRTTILYSGITRT